MRQLPTLCTAALTLAAMSCASPPLEAQTETQLNASSTDYTEPYQQRALEIYRDSIAMRTARGHEQTPVLAEYLATALRDGGFPEADIHVIPFDSNGENVAALVARYRGDGSSGKKPVLLVAHMDIVDALPVDWARDPFTLIEEDGYFFGRATHDDKYGTTMLTAAFLRLKADGYVPDRDLIIAFTGDEETAGRSTSGLVNEHRDLVDAEFALNADAGGGILDSDGLPVSYRIQAAEKTSASFEIIVTNPGGHSSAPRPDNAIYQLAGALKKIEAHKFPVQHLDITLDYLRQSADVTPGELGEAMRAFAADPTDLQAADILARDPGLNGILRTTCVATMLDAGHAGNALPQSATAYVNCRMFPGDEAAYVRQALADAIDDPEVEVKGLGDPVAAPASPLRDDVTSAITKALHARFPGTPVIPFMAPYATDGAAIRSAGIPTYGTTGLFTRPEEVFVHGLNERIPVASFYGGLEYWNVLLRELGG